VVRVPAGLDVLELNTALAQMGGPEREALDARGATGAEQTLDDQQAPDCLLGRRRQHQPFELGERIRRVDHEAEVAVDLRLQRLAKKPGAEDVTRDDSGLSKFRGLLVDSGDGWRLISQTRARGLMVQGAAGTTSRRRAGVGVGTV
jgi:putative component of toxin-antitoxin plasmid stabilization module